MSDFKARTQSTVDDAMSWANESAERNLTTFVDAVQSILDDDYDADRMAKDASKLVVGAQQDAARMFVTWSNLMVGLTGE